MSFQRVRALVPVRHDGVLRIPGVTTGENAQDFVVRVAQATRMIELGLVAFIEAAEPPATGLEQVFVDANGGLRRSGGQPLSGGSRFVGPSSAPVRPRWGTTSSVFAARNWSVLSTPPVGAEIIGARAHVNNGDTANAFAGYKCMYALTDSASAADVSSNRVRFPTVNGVRDDREWKYFLFGGSDTGPSISAAAGANQFNYATSDWAAFKLRQRFDNPALPPLFWHGMYWPSGNTAAPGHVNQFDTLGARVEALYPDQVLRAFMRSSGLDYVQGSGGNATGSIVNDDVAFTAAPPMFVEFLYSRPVDLIVIGGDSIEMGENGPTGRFSYVAQGVYQLNSQGARLAQLNAGWSGLQSTVYRPLLYALLARVQRPRFVLAKTPSPNDRVALGSLAACEARWVSNFLDDVARCRAGGYQLLSPTMTPMREEAQSGWDAAEIQVYNRFRDLVLSYQNDGQVIPIDNHNLHDPTAIGRWAAGYGAGVGNANHAGDVGTAVMRENFVAAIRRAG